MPVIGEFYTSYWAITDTAAPPSAGPGIPGYPLWQAGPVHLSLGMGLGQVGLWVATLWDRWRWWWRTSGRVLRLHGEDRLVLLRTLDALEHPAYPLARVCVRKTATTLGFNRAEAWKELGQALKRSPGNAENTFRHLESCRLLRFNLLPEVHSTLTNPACHLIVELAYQGFAASGR